MDGRSRELDTERMKKFEYGVVARLGLWRKRLVEAFAPKSCILCELCHASGASLVGSIKRGDIASAMICFNMQLQTKCTNDLEDRVKAWAAIT